MAHVVSMSAPGALGAVWRLVQSLNSPFFPPHIGAEPGRANEESRGRFLKGGINYTRYNSYSRDKSAIPGIKMGSRKPDLSLE